MEKHEDSHEQELAPTPTETESETSEIGEEELDQVNGGIIVVGGKQSITSRFDKVSLNPQPLPPRIFDVSGKI